MPVMDADTVDIAAELSIFDHISALAKTNGHTWTRVLPDVVPHPAARVGSAFDDARCEKWTRDGR